MSNLTENYSTSGAGDFKGCLAVIASCVLWKWLAKQCMILVNCWIRAMVLCILALIFIIRPLQWVVTLYLGVLIGVTVPIIVTLLVQTGLGRSLDNKVWLDRRSNSIWMYHNEGTSIVKGKWLGDSA